MSDLKLGSASERILVLAPSDDDAESTRRLLADAGLVPVGCVDLGAIVGELSRGAAVVVLPEESLSEGESDGLAAWIAGQPHWSDIPMIVLTRDGANSEAARRAVAALGNVTLLERPVRAPAFVSTVKAGLRARRRQYQVRDHLRDRDRAEAALREADRRKDEFLAMLAHELRNPLAAITNAARVARDEATEADRSWSQAVIEAQSKHLAILINDLLDVSRITRGKVVLRRSVVELGPLIAAAIESTRPLIVDRGHALDVRLGPDPIVLDADPTRIEQVFASLIGNAAKYTEPGGRIRIEARVEGDLTVVEVSDTGIGMSPDLIERAFDLFAQGDRTIARSEGGLGIGLTLVRSLVERHGGSAIASSAGPGRGTTITVRLPTVVAARSGPDIAIAPKPESKSGPANVLVVDDNVDMARGMVRLLGCLGHRVHSAHDGHAALDLARVHRPDVVLLDIGLPGIDGFEVARRLRLEGFATTTLIAVTGYGEGRARDDARSAGFDHHLVKPVDFDLLASLIDAR